MTDTPGLLNRKEKDRNKMELLTLACLEYLPSAIVYVMDLTGKLQSDILVKALVDVVGRHTNEAPSQSREACPLMALFHLEGFFSHNMEMAELLL